MCGVFLLQSSPETFIRTFIGCLNNIKTEMQRMKTLPRLLTFQTFSHVQGGTEAEDYFKLCLSYVLFDN
jgi:hypothetical protein